ncbi:MAG: glycosyltransferase family 4 protein, partial [Planctomycetota bacterium]|nr:glycosyltransferase family 4 protein [Planctomycetota bacterium]
MKLAIPIDHLDPSRGGLERYVAEASAALARRGHEVHVPCVSATSIPDGVRVHELPIPPGPRSLRRFARACESWIERADLDVS